MEETDLSTEAYDVASVDAAFETEVRTFIAWARDTLKCVRRKVDDAEKKLHIIEKHCITQNGNIELVMERERETHECCGKAHELAQQNALDIVALKTSTRAEREHDRQREGEMRSEVEWLRENVWKIALGGVSLLALVDQVAAIVQRLGAP